MDEAERKTRARTFSRARARAQKAGASRGEADVAGQRALCILDSTLLVKHRRDAMKQRVENNREDVRATAFYRARQRGADEAAAEKAGLQALAEFDAARKERRHARLRDAMSLLRREDALPEIEARELWRDAVLPVRERVLAALRCRHRATSLGELRQRVAGITAQLESKSQITRRLCLYVSGSIDDMLGPLPADVPTITREEPRPWWRRALAFVSTTIAPAPAAAVRDVPSVAARSK